MERIVRPVAAALAWLYEKARWRAGTLGAIGHALVCLVRGHEWRLVGTIDHKRPGFRDTQVDLALCARCGQSAMKLALRRAR